MSKGWNCPVDGCDFGEHEDRSRGSVLSHINAKADSDHDRAARSAVQEADDPPVLLDADGDDPDSALEGAEAGDEHASEQGDEGASNGSTALVVEGTDSEQGEQRSEGADSGDSGASEQGESGASEGGMATPQEYQDQQARSSGEESSEKGASSGDSESDPEEQGEQGTEQGSSGGVPALDTQTMLLLAGALAVAAALYWFVLRDDESTDAPTASTSDEEDDESAQEGAEAAEAGDLWE